ncbi:phosphoribosylanthranilate isomerase [Pseudoroseicyclus tamaricis]|uniref:N-(5'-phosphoribosyl)anthranilate isomerase n=1 Tax=Pseudoroseicyclus tamaricis TaxID=2705421 RepID=A0A6B2JJ41_9RHOB|nr:phosphoribosylanthranilate isomerase [Pseudoroseicyclus tamaricis]NDV01431.1 phosphoribosylanthranilate isomerase [Pseudoroseicyclus tamaricis]
MAAAVLFKVVLVSYIALVSIRLKICGLREAEHVVAAAEAGAAYFGFVFFPRSPRNVSAQEARMLAGEVPMGRMKVGLFVNPSDELLASVLDAAPLDMIQLHGAEPPERVAEVRGLTGLPVMKAVGVAEAADLALLEAQAAVADQLLVDAKAPKGAALPGGNGVAFDWRLIANRRWPVPWMLAGGLTAQNVAEAVRLTGARQVDVSSGVESAPGQKDSARIHAFARALGADAAP